MQGLAKRKADASIAKDGSYILEKNLQMSFVESTLGQKEWFNDSIDCSERMKFGNG